MSSLSLFEQVEEDPETNIFSTEDMERFVEQFIQNQKFNNYLSEFFLNHQDSPVTYRQYYRKKKGSRPISSVLTGLRQPTSKNFLEEDIYSIMMMTKTVSWEWLLGILSFSIQIILAGIIIQEQTQTEFFGTDMSIPIRVHPLTRVTQC